MSEHMRTQITGEYAEISIKVPITSLKPVEEAIKGIIELANKATESRPVNDEGDEVFTVEEVFPDGSPAMMLRGMRGKAEMTQEALAKALNITQKRVSELEMGKRTITPAMAKRLGEVFDTSYKRFL